MQVTKGTCMAHAQTCVSGSLSSSPAQEPGIEARQSHALGCDMCGVLRVSAVQVIHSYTNVQ